MRQLFMRYLCLLFLLIPVVCFAQLKIEGKVLSEADGKPVADASVFLNNETIGTKTGADGTFALRNLSAGQHNLIVSILGFETYSQTLMVNTDMALGDIKLLLKVTMLNEVQIANDPRAKRKLSEFEQQFLGTSEFARQCEILNPEVLSLKYSRDGNVLTGNSADFLEIVNNALGYKLKYLISNFVVDKNENKVAYEGSVLFEEMDSTDFQKKRWKQNRRSVYFGSATHFLREVVADRVDSSFSVETKGITASYNSGKTFSSRQTRDVLHVAEYVHRTEKQGVFAMGNNKDLDVFYIGHTTAKGLKTGYKPQRTHGTISFTDPYLYFDSNGTILNPLGAIFGLSWGSSRVAQLLPLDYWPDEK